MAITVKVNRYCLYLTNPEDKVRYEAIEAECTALGYKLMDVSNPGGYPPEGEHIIDEKHLFHNQYNTIYGDPEDNIGYRVHDWYEGINWNNRNQKVGYYLTGDIAQLKTAKDNRLSCGYCGTQYDKETTTHKLCTKCVGSEYLKEDNWPLLVLRPVSQDRYRDHEALKHLLNNEPYKSELEAAKVEREKLVKARLFAKGEKLLIDVAKKVELELYEAHVNADLLKSGIDTDNLIFYSHIKEWVWGWRTPISSAERQLIMTHIDAIRDKLPDTFTGHLEFKMTGD